MFRKVQLKFFSIISGTLLAIFLAVLLSINVIMDAVMERQSKLVLEQVAAGVEYDDATATFTFVRPDGDKRPHNDIDVQPTEKSVEEEIATPAATTFAAEVSTQPQTSVAFADDDRSAVQSEGNSQGEAPDQPELNTGAEVPEPDTAEESSPEEQRPAVQPPARQEPDDADANDEDVDEQPPVPAEPWSGWQRPTEPEPRAPWERGADGVPWGWGWGGWGYEREKGVSFPTAFTAGESGAVLDGFTVLANTATAVPAATSSASAENSKQSGGQLYLREGSEPVPKSLGSIDFFIIMADNDGNYLATLNNDDLSETLAQKYVTAILDQDVSSGMLMDQYQFQTEKKSNGTLMVFTDKSQEIDMLKKLMRITIIIGAISVILLSAAAYFLSGLIVRPIKEAFDKQKQFVSDASHELKTPLTVISANADVLSGEIGNNKWLTYIRDQTDRMNVLVNDLLSLTRLENNATQLIMTEFDLSKAITNTALPFECRAFETNKNFVLNIDEGITVNGSEQHIKQMAAIFIDNALKYSKDGGTVRVSLTREGERKVFSVYNTGNGVKEEDVDKIFERFYRSDVSRNRSTGGYGLGLAIARSIIDRHRFRLRVENAEGKSICFIVTMP